MTFLFISKRHTPIRHFATIFIRWFFATFDGLLIIMPILSLQEIYPSTFHLTVYGDFQTVMYTEDTKFILKKHSYTPILHPSGPEACTNNWEFFLYDKPSPCSLTLYCRVGFLFGYRPAVLDRWRTLAWTSSHSPRKAAPSTAKWILQQVVALNFIIVYRKPLHQQRSESCSR